MKKSAMPWGMQEQTLSGGVLWLIWLFFYTDTFGISASAAALLFLIVRLSDGITDIIMGNGC